jgi:hypothetical protein
MPKINQRLDDVKDEDMQGGGGWHALEDGDYPFMVTASEYKPTGNGKGMCLHLSVQCMDPRYQRSRWREFLTLEHPNAQTVTIARAQLKQLAIAIGHPNPDFVEYSEDLHNKIFTAYVIARPADDPKYGDVDGLQNRIAGYKPRDGAPPTRREEPRSQRSASDDEPPPHQDSDGYGF